jgi:hypothetical protein
MPGVECAKGGRHGGVLDLQDHGGVCCATDLQSGGGAGARGWAVDWVLVLERQRHGAATGCRDG